jgi:hypothetical protein
MGSADFRNLIKGDSLADAFSQARSNAQHLYGHGGYTGTIAEKHDYVTIIDEPLHPAAAAALAERLITAEDQRIADKRGPAGVIPVAPASAFRVRTKTLTVRSGKLRRELVAMDMACEALPREQIAEARIVEAADNCTVEVKRASGRQRRTFEVLQGERAAGRKVTPTVAEAIAEAIALAEADAGRGMSVTYRVRGAVVAENGGALATIRSTQRLRRVKLEVTIASPKHPSHQRPIAGWLVFGFAPE